MSETPPGDGSVIITPKEMYDQLVVNTRAVEKLTDTIGPAMATLRADHDDLVHRVDDAEETQVVQGNRITKVETKLWAAGAFLTLADFAVGAYAVLGHR